MRIDKIKKPIFIFFIIPILVFSFVIQSLLTNSNYSYSLNNQNLTQSSLPSTNHQYIRQSAIYNYSLVNVSIPRANVQYFVYFYVAFDDLNKSVNLSDFQNVGLSQPGNSNNSVFLLSWIQLANQDLHLLHGTVSTYVSKISLNQTRFPVKKLPISGPFVNESYAFRYQNQTTNEIDINFYDPIKVLNNGKLTYVPHVGLYDFAYSFHILTFEEFGFYKFEVSNVPVNFNFQLNLHK